MTLTLTAKQMIRLTEFAKSEDKSPYEIISDFVTELPLVGDAREQIDVAEKELANEC